MHSIALHFYPITGLSLRQMSMDTIDSTSDDVDILSEQLSIDPDSSFLRSSSDLKEKRPFTNKFSLLAFDPDSGRHSMAESTD